MKTEKVTQVTQVNLFVLIILYYILSYTEEAKIFYQLKHVNLRNLVNLFFTQIKDLRQMQYSINGFSDCQINELKQCPGVNIDMGNLIAEVPFMTEGLFLSISKNANGNTGKTIRASIEKHISKAKGSIETSKHKANIEEQVIAPTIEKTCKCGIRATIYDFGEIGNGKLDWTFYCNSCSPYKEIAVKSALEQRANYATYKKITEGANSGTVKPVVPKTCAKCCNLGERYCFGEFDSGKFSYGFFCLECKPYHF